MPKANTLMISPKQPQAMTDKEPTATPEPLLACTVLITPSTIGEIICAAGAVVRLPKSQAETLASLTPPVVRIDGI